MSKVNLIGYGVNELSDLMLTLGAPSFKGRQLFKWFYKFQQTDFQLMTDLTKELRTRLDAGYTFEGLNLDEAVKAADGTERLLFRLHDGHPVETVLIPDEEKHTVCLSSQSGCALGCKFCATGTMGLLRDLTVAEIVGQLVIARERLGLGGLGNIVLMGMGEPLNNFENVLAAVRIITNENGMDISPKRITISTSGISPRIRQLADSGLRVRLAVSLNAAIQEKRETIMPLARTYALDGLIAAVKYYAEKTKSRVTIEYVLFKGFNDTAEDIQALAGLLRGVPCKVNVLAYNPVPGLVFERPTDEDVDRFGRRLYPLVPAVTVRRSRGLDIDAACGQLAARKRSKGVYHG